MPKPKRTLVLHPDGSPVLGKPLLEAILKDLKIDLDNIDRIIPLSADQKRELWAFLPSQMRTALKDRKRNQGNLDATKLFATS